MERLAKDYKALYRKLEATLDRIDQTEDPSVMLTGIVESLIAGFREELGFEGGRLYRRRGNDFVLVSGHGVSRDVSPGLVVPRGYPPHERTLAEGLLIMSRGESGFDDDFERAIGVRSTFAAIAVGDGSSHVIAFSVAGEVREEQILYSLTAVRHAVNLRLRQQELRSTLEEARTIQESLLPVAPPSFDGYDIAGRSRPTEIVGGDLFDYLPLSPNLLGVAIADASGHGLPAALLARDVITGLRVGMDEDLKVVRVVERLNRVIHRAALSSRFISLFYGEFERNGTLIYCNAGHNPPILLRRGAFRMLLRGGLVLGPNPAATYAKGHARLRDGDLAALYTDGLVEAANPQGRRFGVPRLKRTLLELDGADAATIVEGVFETVDAFREGAPPQDDMTLTIVRKV